MQDKEYEMTKYFILGLLPVFLLVGCKKEPAPTVPVAQSAKVEKILDPIVEEKKEKPIYLYQGDKFRDPFLPSGVSSSYQSNAVFDPKRVTLKAIIFGSKYNSAVLTQGNGISYFVKSGILFDVMGKTVQGYTAQVFENKIILIGEDDNQYELKIRNTEKGGDSL